MRSVPWRCLRRSGPVLTLSLCLTINKITVFYCLVGELEVTLDAFVLGVTEWEYDMSLFSSNPNLVQPRCSSNDGLYIVLFQQVRVSGCMDISEEECSGELLAISGEDDVVGVLRCVIIMGHNNMMMGLIRMEVGAIEVILLDWIGIN